MELEIYFVFNTYQFIPKDLSLEIYVRVDDFVSILNYETCSLSSASSQVLSLNSAVFLRLP